MLFHAHLNLLYQTEHHSLKSEISDKAKQEEEKLKAFYKDDQNQSNSSTKDQNLLPCSSTCTKSVVLYSLEIRSVHTINTGSAL